MADDPPSPEEVDQQLQELLQKHDLSIDIGLEIGGMKRQAGRYSHSDRTIRLSRHLLTNHPDRVGELLRHELGHALAMERHGDGIAPHGEEWRDAMADLGVEDPSARHSLQLAPYKYILRCRNEDCANEIGRYRRSKVVKAPGQYRCGSCGSPLERRR